MQSAGSVISKVVPEQLKIIRAMFAKRQCRCAGKPTIEVTPEYDQNGDPVTR